MNNVISELGAKASRVAEQVDEMGHGAAESLHAAASSVRKSGKRSAETIEDVRLDVEGNAAPGVGNLQAHFAQGALGRQGDRTPGRRVAQGVFHQVVEHVVKLIGARDKMRAEMVSRWS